MSMQVILGNGHLQPSSATMEMILSSTVRALSFLSHKKEVPRGLLREAWCRYLIGEANALCESPLVASTVMRNFLPLKRNSMSSSYV